MKKYIFLILFSSFYYGVFAQRGELIKTIKYKEVLEGKYSPVSVQQYSKVFLEIKDNNLYWRAGRKEELMLELKCSSLEVSYFLVGENTIGENLISYEIKGGGTLYYSYTGSIWVKKEKSLVQYVLK